jgi:hypothetical protein
MNGYTHRSAARSEACRKPSVSDPITRQGDYGKVDYERGRELLSSHFTIGEGIGM